MRPANTESNAKFEITSGAGETEPSRMCTEKHYSVAELADIWKLSENTIRRMFENEPGVIKWGPTESRFKRRYITLRIPETVVLRVHRQLRAAS
jgi:hypothetical protein